MIVIHSRLTRNDRQRMRRAAAFHADRMDPRYDWYCWPDAAGRYHYCIPSDDAEGETGVITPHGIARRLMSWAGRTFEYEITD